MKANFFYNYKLGDILFIVIDNDLLPTHFVKYNDIVVIYHKSEIIGVNIYNISNICKIKINGRIHLPPIVLIELLNSLLSKYDINLDIVNESLFCVGKVVNHFGNVFDVDIGKIVKVVSDKSVVVSQLYVIAKKGALLSNGEFISEDGYICTYRDLSLLDNDELIVLDEKNVSIGQDFFLKGGSRNGRI